jgi:zinc protease
MKQIFLNLAKGVLLSALLAIGFVAQAQTKLSYPLAVSPDIKIGKLSNGLTYYIRKNGRPEKKVELRLVVKVGSIMEDDDQQGLAHFTEHMAFNGTKNFKKNELVSFLQSIGVQFGADLNAYTSFDETVYILPIPTDKPENLDKGFLVLEDWASTVSFDDTEIDKERGVVLEESRLGKGANDRMNKSIYPKLFAGSKYAQRLPIGKDDILKNFKYDVVKRFYKDWYRPDLMAVVVVGDIDVADAEGRIKAHFEKLKNPTKERPRDYAEIPGRSTSEGLSVTDKEATNNILQIYYSTKKSKAEITLGDYRNSIIKSLFSAMLGQRLQELTQKPNPPFVFAGSGPNGFVRGHEAYSSFMLVGKSGAEPAISAIIQENERVRNFGFIATELDRSKKSLLRQMERQYNEREKTESKEQADELIRNYLVSEPIPGIESEFNYHKEFLQTITLEELNQYAAKIVPSSEGKLVVFSGSDKSETVIPTSADLLSLVSKAEQMPVTAYEEKAVAANLMEKIPVAGKIINEKENKQVGYTELTLSNGVKIIFKKTDFKNDQIVMSATRFGGQSLYDQKDNFNAAYATTTVGQMGVRDLSPIDLRKVLAGKTANASPLLGPLTEGVRGQSGMADLETMLQLTYLYFTQPRKDEALFASFVSKQQAMVQNMMSNPQAVFQDSVQKILYNNHPRGPRFPKAADFSKINIDRALEIYKERFGNANGFTFLFVGSFDANKLKELVSIYLGSLPSAPLSPMFKDLGVRPVKGVVKREIKRGSEPKSFISMAFTGEAPYTEEANFKLQVLIEVMNIKLIETLREDLSGIYGGGMRGSMSKNPYNNYTINVSLPCGPENVEKLIAATFAEIQKVKDNGPLEADLNKVKETLSKKHVEDMRDNNYWLTKLQQSIDLGADTSEILTFEKRLSSISVKDLREAALKHFNFNNYLQAVLNPEK